MRFIPLRRAEAGMVLARALFDNEHRILLNAGTELTDEFITNLNSRGLSGVYIEDELTKDIMINEAISEELKGKAVDCLAKQDIDATLDVVQAIVDQLSNSDIISLDMIDLRTFDEYTYRHSVNVAVLSTVIGIAMNMNYQSLKELCTAAILHDLGKLRIESTILNKPGKLTDEEYTIMKTHSQLSYDLIKDKYEITGRTRNAVLSHHENCDGSGYPRGIAGDDIHEFAKIIHVVDVYDALTTARPYKSAFSPLESMEFLVSKIGIMFDEEVVNTFVKYVPPYPKGVTVLLSNGEEAIVVENHMGNGTMPVVRLMDGTDIDLSSQKWIGHLTILRTIEDENRTGQANAHKRHIHIVDDNMSDLRKVEEVLRDNYRVSVSKSAMQAAQLLYRRRPELIIMNVNMPGVDGFEAVELIRSEIDSTIPFIFITSHPDKVTVMRAKEMGAIDFIVKPFEPFYLRARIQAVFEQI